MRVIEVKHGTEEISMDNEYRENLLMENEMMIMMIYTEMLYHEVPEVESDTLALLQLFRDWAREFEDYAREYDAEWLDDIEEFARHKISTCLSSYEAYQNM